MLPSPPLLAFFLTAMTKKKRHIDRRFVVFVPRGSPLIAGSKGLHVHLMPVDAVSERMRVHAPVYGRL